MSVDIVKRRGPHCDNPFFIPLADMPAGRQLLDVGHEITVKRVPATAAIGNGAAVLV